MNISAKRILIMAAAAVAILGIILVVGLVLKKKGAETPEQNKTEIVQACIKGLDKTDFSMLVDSTEQLCGDFAYRGINFIYHTYPLVLLRKHLSCEFLQEQNEEKKNALVDYAMEADQGIVFVNREEAWKRAEPRLREAFIYPEEFFINNLAWGNMADICPDKLPINCKKDNGIFFQESDEWCANICETLVQYEEDKDKLDKEVINFKKEDIDALSDSYFPWQLAVAYRFGGKDLARKVCDNIDDMDKRVYCYSQEIYLEGNSLDCGMAIEDLSRLLCEYQYRDY
jgi:hypothetical protein